jgi:hypothetical protein
MEHAHTNGTSEIARAAPLRLEGIHFVYDDPRYDQVLKKLVQRIESRETKVRMRTHHGSLEQNKLALSSVGIPVAVLPFDDQHRLTLHYHKEWLKQRKALEQKRNATAFSPPAAVEGMLPRARDKYYEEPTESELSDMIKVTVQPRDVLPGVAYKAHLGNICYHHILDEHVEEYEAADINEKTTIALEIVDKIHAQGGRFLKEKDCGGGVNDWIIMDTKDARKKVAMAFRDKRKWAAVKKKRQEDPKAKKIK